MKSIPRRLAEIVILFTCLVSGGLVHAADVVSTFKAAAGVWSSSTNWTNSPFLGGFPNNGNAGVATYDAIVPSGTVTNDTNIVIQKFTQSAGTVTGSQNLTANDVHTWTGGTLSGSGTNFDIGGLAVTGTVFLASRQLQSLGAATIAGGSMHLSSGAVITNVTGVAFSFTDDSAIFNDGGAPAPVFQNVGTVDKTGAGNGIGGVGAGISRIDTPLFNQGVVRSSVGTLQIAGTGITTSNLNAAAGARLLVSGTYTLDGATWSGAGTGEVSSGTTTLTNNVTATVATFVHSGGTISGPGNLSNSGTYKWTSGTESGSGTNILTGPLAIAGTVFLSGRQIQSMASATLAGGSVHLSSGGTISNLAGVAFSFTDDSTVFNDGGAPSPVFQNAGTVDKTGAGNNISGVGAGISRIDAPLFNQGVVRASVGTLQIAGTGVTTSNLNAAAGARLLVSGTYTLDGATWSGAGTGEVSSGTTTLTNNVTATVATLVHSGGTISGPGNLSSSGTYKWTSGTESGSGTNILTGPLAIAGTVFLSGRQIQSMASATLAGGSLHLSSGGTFSNLAGVAFSITDDSAVFNDGGVPAPAFLNAGTVDKTGAGNGIGGVGAGISRIDPPLFNQGVVRASVGTLQIAGTGITTSNLNAAAGARLLVSGTYTLDGATWSGAGTGEVSSGTTTLTNNVTATVATLVHSGGTIGGPGNLASSGTYKWTAGTESGSGTNTLTGPAAIDGTVFLSGRRIQLMASATLAGGSVHMSSGGVIANEAPSSFDIVDDSSVFNDGGVPTSSFLNAGTLMKSGSGNGISGVGAGISRVDVPFTNSGTVIAQSGTLDFTSSYFQTAGSTVVTGGVISASVPIDIEGGSVSGTGIIVGTVTNNGTISPGFSPGVLHFQGNVTCKSNSVLAIEIGGPIQGTNYDLVDVTNAAVLAGILQVSFFGGYQASIPPGAVFTVVTAGGSLTGAFSNVASGSRLATIDGFGSFLVTYNGATKTVVLSGFTPSPVIVADFNANPTNGAAPLTVTFTNLTSGPATNFLWNFGDGTVSAAANPVHTYTNTGTYTVSLTATGAVGTNTITKTNFIGVTSAGCVLTITCPTNMVLATSPGLCARTNITYVVTFSTNCPGAVLTQTAGLPSGSTFPKGITTNTFVVTDANSNIVNCSFTITVLDTEPPSLVCPTNMVLSTDPGQCSASNVTFVVTVKDNCPGVTVICIPPSGSTFPKGVTIVNCIATDASGNTNQCSFTVTVSDKEPPVITCSTNIVLLTDPGQCSASNVTFVVTVKDNCPGATVVCNPPSGSTFLKGVTIVTCVATDASGNTNQCSFTVTVNDKEPPTITCPANMVVPTDPGQCSASNVTFVVGVDDNCPGVTVVCKPPSGSTFPKGVTIVTCIATDASGNTNQCSFTVTVIDTQPPSITCSSNIVVIVAAGQNNVVVNFAAPIASDNCTNVTASCVPASGSAFPVGITVVTCTAVDSSGNTNTCAFTVTVTTTNMNTAPSITCPAEIVTNNAPGLCSRMLAFAPVVAGSPAPTVTCTIGSNVITSPYAFPVGTNLVTCSASNVAGKVVCVFTVIVLDVDPPVMTCPTNMVVAAPLGQLGTIVDYVAAALDICDGAVAVLCTPKPGYFAVGQTIVTCVAVDRAGNSNMCAFVVTVTATKDPVRLCSLTQGFWGNTKGMFNGFRSLVLLKQLLAQAPLVVGKIGLRSLSILSGDEVLLEQRLPSGGPPAALPNNGDQTLETAVLPLNRKGRFDDILLGQTITLSLNVRLSPDLLSFMLASNSWTEAILAGPDGLKGTTDDIPVTHDVQTFVVPGSVFNALQDPKVGITNTTVQGLLELANLALAGLSTGAATLGDITAAVDAINRGFDECRLSVICEPGIGNADAFNDDFDIRPILDPPPPPDPLLNVRVRSSNLTATKEPGEPDIAGNPGGKSVWWQWPSPITGPVSISTIGSSFDTLLGVYTGSAISNLVLVASNDDAEGTLQSDVTFQAIAGTNYQITVDGFDGASGEIVLTLVAAPVRFCEPVTVNGNQVQLCVDGEIGRSYSILASPDLVNWTLVATAVNTNGSLVFNDPARSNWPRRFYTVFFEP
jgi:PKD repeat protein